MRWFVSGLYLNPLRRSSGRVYVVLPQHTSSTISDAARLLHKPRSAVDVNELKTLEGQRAKFDLMLIAAEGQDDLRLAALLLESACPDDATVGLLRLAGGKAYSQRGSERDLMTALQGLIKEAANYSNTVIVHFDQELMDLQALYDEFKDAIRNLQSQGLLPEGTLNGCELTRRLYRASIKTDNNELYCFYLLLNGDDLCDPNRDEHNIEENLVRSAVLLGVSPGLTTEKARQECCKSSGCCKDCWNEIDKDKERRNKVLCAIALRDNAVSSAVSQFNVLLDDLRLSDGHRCTLHVTRCG